MRVSDERAPPPGAAALDAGERRHARSLRDRADRARYVAAHHLLRTLLSRRLGQPPGALAYVAEPCECCGASHGRPAVRGAGEAHFSLSSSGDLVLVAIASVSVGVDVERRPGEQTRVRAASLLHPAECRELARAGPDQQAAAFARVWTRKEAFLKGIGAGLAHGAADPYLGAGDEAVSPPGWSVCDLDLDLDGAGGYAAALAVRSEAIGLAQRPVCRASAAPASGSPQAPSIETPSSTIRLTVSHW